MKITKRLSLCSFAPALLLLQACGSEDISYFPLQEGKSWEYKVTTQDMDMQKQSVELITNVAPRNLDDKNVSTRSVNGELLFFYEKADEGVRLVGMKRPKDINTVYEKKEHFVLKLPLQEGTSWEQETITGVLAVVMDPFRRHFKLRTPVQMRYTVKNVDSTVKVSAGHFTQCAEVVGLGKTKVDPDKSLGQMIITVASTDWYCPGVGLVKSERVESTDNRILSRGDFNMELLKYDAG